MFRVEDSNGRGMYHSPLRVCDMEDMYDSATHPCPWNDSKLIDSLEVWTGDIDFQRHHYFGFESPKQLLRWVYRREWWENLDFGGFKVSVFFAEGVAGNTQAIYDYSTREPNLGRVSLLDIQRFSEADLQFDVIK